MIKQAASIISADNSDQDRKQVKRKFFDCVFIFGFFCALIPGPLPQLTSVISLLLLGCIMISFFDENFYLYLAIFIYLRYRLLLGDTPAFRIYSYLVVLRFLKDMPDMKFRIAYLPAIFVFALHSIIATGRFESIRIGLNVIVDCVLAYLVVMKILQEPKLFRKFIFAFILGGVASGIYGWTSTEFTKEINVSGAGAHKVSRNFGALSDANFAGLFYSLCLIFSLITGGIPKWLRYAFAALFAVMILQTASLSALLILSLLSMFLIILKYRTKSIFILSFAFFALVLAVCVILAVPQLRQIGAIQGLIIHSTEKLSYIPRGRWDLLTTDRYAIWQAAGETLAAKSIWGKLVGGSVVTVMTIDTSTFYTACHNSYLQSILNFGIAGTILIYVPVFLVFVYRVLKHFSNSAGYENEDIQIMRLLCVFAFIVFGMTVDFFIDWPFMFLYFI